MRAPHLSTQTRFSRFAAATTVAALFAALVPAVIPATAAPETSASPTVRQAATQFAFRTQKLHWKPCSEGSTADCATFKVPLDYTDPTGPRLRIAISRQKATGEKLGSIVFDPGGPGGSGAEYIETGIAALPAGIRASFDFIGLDPRGVGGSTQITCLTQATFDNQPLSLPTNLETKRAFVKEGQAVAPECERLSPGMIAHVGTRDAARDMDILRSILRERKLNYLGISYGTYLGAVYSSLFGDRVGRFVLDANMDPDGRMVEVAKSQASGFQDSLQRWADNCATATQCPFSGDGEQVVSSFTRKLRTLNTTPMPVTGGTDLGYLETIQLVQLLLAQGRDAWPIVNLVAIAMKSHDGTDLQGIRLAVKASLNINLISANKAINCFDRPSPGSQALALKRIRAWQTAAPTFAFSMGWGSIDCGWWPARDAQAPGDLPFSGAPRILLVGGTHDPNTPLAGTYAMQEKLPGSRVLIWDGDGHGASTKGDACVNDTLTRFFVKGKIPADGKRCTAA